MSLMSIVVSQKNYDQGPSIYFPIKWFEVTNKFFLAKLQYIHKLFLFSNISEFILILSSDTQRIKKNSEI